MKATSLLQLGYKHARNDILEEIYLNTGIDKVKPVVIYGIVNERCNYKCRYCEYWRLPKYQDELSIQEWKDALTSLHDYIGSFHIEFSGGEPFIKKDFIELLEFCHHKGLKWGVTTNGSGLTKSIVERVVAAQPFNINISMDAHIAEIHDYVRGIPGSLERITKQLKMLIEERNKKNQTFPITIKPVVHASNLHILHEIPKWAQALGATAVNFQPIDRWTDETYSELWVNEDRFSELQTVVENLLEQKKAGMPILNSETTLKLWPAHFREEKAPSTVGACRVGLRNYFIRTNGDVEVCWYYSPIGNVKRQTAREIWESEDARLRRKETTSCDRLCLFTCLSQKTILDKAKMAFTLLKN
ncbi:radical SAM protein [Methylocucumis oryzae]|uniref:Radical SAM protein n=1 Tax=Methylocucumis oryzae TaxID=1632867 RepID=A0A0F3IHM2_9GAMM|nr:radical SAM protein [Methylocucumis oryzae]KJV06246.1 radical SAM protein [Methylocucumis oryzae]